VLISCGNIMRPQVPLLLLLGSKHCSNIQARQVDGAVGSSMQGQAGIEFCFIQRVVAAQHTRHPGAVLLMMNGRRFQAVHKGDPPAATTSTAPAEEGAEAGVGCLCGSLKAEANSVAGAAAALACFSTISASKRGHSTAEEVCQGGLLTFAARRLLHGFDGSALANALHGERVR